MRARRKKANANGAQRIMLAESDGRPRGSRDIESLTGRKFDLLVIGGGIVGSGIAWDAALRGLSVALIERNDFGGGTSSGCFRIVHGGMRYLQHLDLSRMKRSVREQRIFRRIAPHLVRPLPVIVPCYGVGKRGKGFLTAGMNLYELLARDRNRGVFPSLQLNRSATLTPAEVLAEAPYLNQENLRGGVTFEDVQMLHAERLTASVALAARDAGAIVCNYVEATGARRDETVRGAKTIHAVTFRDLLTGKEGEAQCRMVVNATGAWAPKVAARLSADLSTGENGGNGGSVAEQFRASLFPNAGLLSKGFQIAVPSVSARYALAVESREKDVTAVLSRGGRSYFIVPWRGLSLIGTTDAPYREDPDDFHVTDEEISDFVGAVKAAYPDPVIRKDEVRFVFGGLLPTETLSRRADDSAIRVGKEDLLIDHRERRKVTSGARKGESLPRIANLLSAAALKYTTFRSFAEEVVDKVVGRLGTRVGHCRTSFTPIAGGNTGDPREFAAAALDDFGSRLTPEQIERLASHYGSDMLEVLEVALEHSSLLEPVAPGSPTLAAEILYAIRYEQALTLSDVVERRTLLGAFGFPGGAALDRTIELMSAELGWDRAREEEELDAVMRHYRMGTGPQRSRRKFG